MPSPTTNLEKNFLHKNGSLNRFFIQTFIQSVIPYMERPSLLILSLIHKIKKFNENKKGIQDVFRFTEVYDTDIPSEYRTYVTIDKNVEILFSYIFSHKELFPNIISLGSGISCYLEILLAGYNRKDILCLDKLIQKEEKYRYITKKHFDWSKDTLSNISSNPEESTLLLCWPPADFHNIYNSPWSTIPSSIIKEICTFQTIVVIVDRFDSCGTEELWKSIEKTHKSLFYKQGFLSTQTCCIYYKK